MSAMDPDPAKTPDLEPGGGVPPGATPPDTPQTSGLSAPEPSTRHHFPVTGVVAMLIGAVVILLFVAAAVGIVVSML
ncbi:MULTISPECIES: DUF6480 family protein [Nocardia]|uniref:Uncharacterized protein n=1 Tax=Nocardia sputorum TaxID=2984338 RepID=A0ABM8CZ22_9NOCA|nr:DUF6480 family protein [Nocardia sputorum]BDT91747.1 hypothetical protein IFM12275_17230 [Nocardia sputorum]BDU00274.1 hypothetical protein IFM12276_33020 [Nocardia sputorum]